MSRLRVSAAVVVGTAMVVLATSCTNDFDQLFEGDLSGTDGGKGDSSKTDKDVASPSGCQPSCELEQNEKDDGTSYDCKSCACTCKLECRQTSKSCTGGCEKGTYCDVRCPQSNDCSLECDPGAACVLRCAKGFSCSLQCTGSKPTACSDTADGTVYACNTECPGK